LDEYHKPSIICRLAFYLLSWYELRPFQSLRTRGMQYAIKFIYADSVETNYLSIGPVNKALNMLATWIHDKDSREFFEHTQRVEDYIWVAEDGVKMQGYIGSQTWDTSFAIQGIIESGLASEYAEIIAKAHSFLKNSQNHHDPVDSELWHRR